MPDGKYLPLSYHIAHHQLLDDQSLKNEPEFDGSYPSLKQPGLKKIPLPPRILLLASFFTSFKSLYLFRYNVFNQIEVVVILLEAIVFVLKTEIGRAHV